MSATTKNTAPRILILASLSGGYRGADATGQSHLGYPPNTYILPMMSAAMFPESFYLKAFERGFDGILVMYSGTDSPYKGETERVAEIIGRTYDLMKERNLDPRRLKLASICTVCVQPFLKEVNSMNCLLADLGSLPREKQPAVVREGAR
jgi:F420-non-reducing hydrogenase iron-sulfur subunit